MVELFIMEYLTVLYMIMAFLFMDGRYSRRRTLFIVSGVTLLLMAAVAALHRAVDMDAAFWIFAITIHIPLILLLFTLSRFRGWRLIFQQLSVVLFCTLIHHISGMIYYLSGSRFWVLVLSCVVLSTGVIWFLVRFLRPLVFSDTARAAPGLVADMPGDGHLLHHLRLPHPWICRLRTEQQHHQTGNRSANAGGLFHFDVPLYQHQK